MNSKYWSLLTVLLCSLLTPITGLAETKPAPLPAKRIVSIGGEITETLFALGMGNAVIAVDTTSTWPQPVSSLPNVGYARQLAAEGILSMKPDLIITNHDAGPPQVLDRIRAAGIALHQITTGPGLEQATTGIIEIANIVNRGVQGEQLVANIRADLAKVNGVLASDKMTKPRAIFVIGGRGGQLLVAGQNTRADTIMTLAGAKNASSHQGYKPVSKEGLMLLNPEVVLVAAHAVPAAGGIAGLMASSGLEYSSVGQAGRIHSIDAAKALSMGAGLGQAVARLARLLHPKMADRRG